MPAKLLYMYAGSILFLKVLLSIANTTFFFCSKSSSVLQFYTLLIFARVLLHTLLFSPFLYGSVCVCG